MPINMQTTLKFLLLLCFSLPSHAEYFRDKYIFGASYIQQYADLKADRGGASDTGNGFGLYLDKYIKHQYRINSTLAYIHYSTFDVTELIIAADYLIPVQTTVSAFVGASVGLASQKYSDASLSDSATGSIKGLQLGIIKYLDDEYLIEIGLRKRTADIKTVIATVPESHSTITNLDEAYIGILFMF